MANPVIIGDGLHAANADGSGVTSALEARRVQAGQWARSGAAGSVVARTGVVYAGATSLIAGTGTVGPPMTVQVAPLHYVAAKASGEGVYLGVVDSTAVLDIAAAPGSNSRIDVVYVMQEDATAGITSPDAQTRGIVSRAQGTAAATPTPPSIPVGAVEVGQVRVYAGATTTNGGLVTISTTARWTALFGSPVPVRDQTERDALTGYEGLRVYRLDKARTEVFTGGAWTGGSWKADSPTVTKTGLTGAVISRRWHVTDDGRVCHMYLAASTGGGFAAGSGDVTIPLPVAASTALPSRRIGQWTQYQASNGNMYIGWVQQASSSTAVLRHSTTWPGGPATGPSFLSAAGDDCQIWVAYETAI